MIKIINADCQKNPLYNCEIVLFLKSYSLNEILTIFYYFVIKWTFKLNMVIFVSNLFIINKKL